MVRPPDPPGPPGRKTEYFLRRSRHGVVAPILLLTGLLQLFGGVNLWMSGSHRGGAAMCALSAASATASLITWRVGKRRQEEVWTDIHIGSAKSVSRPQRD